MAGAIQGLRPCYKVVKVMAYARKSASRSRSRAPARSRAGTRRVRAVARKPAARRTGSKRGLSKRPAAVRLVIEHQTTNPVQRPELDGMIATRNTKKARF